MIAELLFHSGHSKVAEKFLISASTRAAVKMMLLRKDMIPTVHVTLLTYMCLPVYM
jgi:hypothetical protein